MYSMHQCTAVTATASGIEDKGSKALAYNTTGS